MSRNIINVRTSYAPAKAPAPLARVRTAPAQAGLFRSPLLESVDRVDLQLTDVVLRVVAYLREPGRRDGGSYFSLSQLDLGIGSYCRGLADLRTLAPDLWPPPRGKEEGTRVTDLQHREALEEVEQLTFSLNQGKILVHGIPREMLIDCLRLDSRIEVLEDGQRTSAEDPIKFRYLTRWPRTWVHDQRSLKKFIQSVGSLLVEPDMFHQYGKFKEDLQHLLRSGLVTGVRLYAGGGTAAALCKHALVHGWGPCQRARANWQRKLDRLDLVRQYLVMCKGEEGLISTLDSEREDLLKFQEPVARYSEDLRVAPRSKFELHRCNFTDPDCCQNCLGALVGVTVLAPGPGEMPYGEVPDAYRDDSCKARQV